MCVCVCVQSRDGPNNAFLWAVHFAQEPHFCIRARRKGLRSRAHLWRFLCFLLCFWSLVGVGVGIGVKVGVRWSRKLLSLLSCLVGLLVVVSLSPSGFKAGRIWGSTPWGVPTGSMGRITPGAGPHSMFGHLVGCAGIASQRARPSIGWNRPKRAIRVRPRHGPVLLRRGPPGVHGADPGAAVVARLVLVVATPVLGPQTAAPRRPGTRARWGLDPRPFQGALILGGP